MSQNQYFDKQDVHGYYLPAHPQFMRLITDEDKERFELKLVLLTLAGSLLRQEPMSTEEQTEYFNKYLAFLINDYPQMETLRPAASHFYSTHKNASAEQLATVARFEELASNVFHEIIGSDPIPHYSACMLVAEQPTKLLKHYRALLWHVILDKPDLMNICADRYALEMLINLSHVRSGVVNAP